MTGKKWFWDILLASGILLLAGIIFFVSRPGGAGAWAVVTADGAEIGRYALDQDCQVTIGGEHWNVLQISRGTAAIIEANCGDFTCVRTGKISREGETIVCLPHHLMVRITGGEKADFDAAAG